MTAVMLESARKGLWKASEEQVAELSKLHTEIVNNYRPSCSGFVCDNAKLRDYIASKADAPTAAQYKENISKIREAKASGNDKGVVMKKEEMNQTTEEQTNTLSKQDADLPPAIYPEHSCLKLNRTHSAPCGTLPEEKRV